MLVDATGANWTVSSGVIYRNGAKTVSSSVTLLLYWNHTVYQQNAPGNWWLWSNNAWQATTDPRVAQNDTQAPTVTITSPANGATFSRRSQFTATASASDNVGVTQVRFYLNGSLVCTDTAAPYQCTMTLPGKSGSTNTIQVQAQDAAGNIGRASTSVRSQ